MLPRPRPHLVLPSGNGPELRLWYHDEPSWLTHALQSLGHPPLDASSTADADSIAATLSEVGVRELGRRQKRMSFKLTLWRLISAPLRLAADRCESIPACTHDSVRHTIKDSHQHARRSHRFGRL